MFGIGLQEALVILVVALIVFGPERLPEIAAQLGKAIREYRRLTAEMHGGLAQLLATAETTEPLADSRPGAAGPPAAPVTLRREVLPDDPASMDGRDTLAAPGMPAPPGHPAGETGRSFRDRQSRARYDRPRRRRRTPTGDGRAARSAAQARTPGGE